MGVVVEVLLSAALSERQRTDRRPAPVRRERAGDHLCSARRVAVDERRDGPPPAVDGRRLGCAVGFQGSVPPPHRKERRPRQEHPERVDRAVGRASPIAPQVEHDPFDRPSAVLALAEDGSRQRVAQVVPDVVDGDDERVALAVLDAFDG